MSKNDTNLLNMICNDYLKSESFKSHINKISEPILQNLLNELGVYLYIFIFFIFISFFLHLGILIILIRYINKTNIMLSK